jgi:hypothetical protein
MDILQVVSENIETNDINSISKLVEFYVKQGRNKTIFACFLVKLYAQNYVSKNLWLIKELAQHVTDIERSGKRKEELIEALTCACNLLAAQEQKQLTLLDKKDNGKNKIERILYASHKEYEDLMEFRDILKQDVYNLLNTLYKNLVHACDLNESFVIIKYLISLKKKDLYYSESTQNDAYDLLFIVLFNFADTNRVPPDVLEYINCSKDLFYYRCKQKDKFERVNLLFYAVFVLTQRRVKYQSVDYHKGVSSHNVPNNMDYLFVWFKYDRDLLSEVKNDREMSKLSRKDEKLVFVDDLGEKERCLVDIIRI